MICATKHSPRKGHTMSLFKRLFGPDEPEEAPDGEVAIEPAQDQSLSPMTPGELAALESSSRSVTLPAGERVAAAAAGYRKAPNAADTRQRQAARQSRQSSLRDSAPEETTHPQLSQSRRPTAVT